MPVPNLHPPRSVTTIERDAGRFAVKWDELYEYRDLFRFWVWRTIKVRYAQSALGVGWAVIQPLFSVLVFTIIFGNLVEIDSNGVPYAVFSLAALVPWTFFANSVNESTASLIQNANIITKIYFPRLILPLATVLAKLVDFAIAMLLLVVFMLWFRIVPTWNVIALPVLILLMMVSASALGIWLTAMAVQYRDVRYGINFVIQLLMYAAPVVYPATLIPDRFQYAYALNPMVGVIEGFRAALLGTRAMPWDLIAIGALTSSLFLLFAVTYFRSKERLFADVA